MYHRLLLMLNLCVNILCPRSVLILAYVVAQALSIYFLLPRKTILKANEKDCKGCLQKVSDISTALTNTTLYKCYKEYRYPWIPLALQFVEMIFQILAFNSYITGVPARYLLIKCLRLGKHRCLYFFTWIYSNKQKQPFGIPRRHQRIEFLCRSIFMHTHARRNLTLFLPSKFCSLDFQAFTF